MSKSDEIYHIQKNLYSLEIQFREFLKKFNGLLQFLGIECTYVEGYEFVKKKTSVKANKKS